MPTQDPAFKYNVLILFYATVYMHCIMMHVKDSMIIHFRLFKEFVIGTFKLESKGKRDMGNNDIVIKSQMLVY